MITIIRSPNPDHVDWNALPELIHESFAYMDGRIDPPSSLHAMGVKDRVQKAVDEILVVAIEGDALPLSLAGCLYCRLHDASCYIGKMAVSPSQQGKGIGRLLMAEAKAIAMENQRRFLELETRIELVENHRVFERWGFSKVSETAHAGYARRTSIGMRCEIKPLSAPPR
ncbi:MAG: GNAT family N-acetyltransferase [Pseudomonadota bacterium]